jgi:hypothetical protein
MRLKYIIFDDNSFVIFDENQKHSEACNRLDIQSAGFCSIDMLDNDIIVTCWGESISLGKKMGSLDASVIRYQITGVF